MVQKIHLNDVLRKIDESIEGEEVRPFSISFALHDTKKGKAGRTLSIENAAKYHGVRGVLQTNDTIIKKQKASKAKSENSDVKNPNHFFNQSRNIVDMDDETRHPIKLHIRLIFMFNGNYVYW